MKIALVVHDYHQQGGHSRYVAELATRFAREHEVHVFANTIETAGDSAIRFHHVPALRATALTTVLTFPFFSSPAVGSGFDIVHAQGVCLHRCDVMTAHICNAAWHAARARLGNLTWKDHLFDSVATPLERAAVSGPRAPWVIAISERVREDLGQFYGRTDRITVIHHGVDAHRFRPPDQEILRQRLRGELGLAGETPLFLFVGDLRKGGMTAIEAVARVGAAHLLCVSRTPLASYRAAADRLSAGARVHFLPPTDRIEAVYAAADALLFPTPYDAFGMVITEAMAAGLPVITTRMAGASECIRHGVNGIVVDDAMDVGGFVTHVESISRSREDAGSLGRLALERSDQLSWQLVADRTMEVYYRCLG